LKIEFHDGENYTVVSLEGELDIENSSDFKEKAMMKILNGHPNMIIDLSQVVYVDSSGLGVLVFLQKNTRLNGGSLVIVGATEQIRRTMKITHLDELFKFYSTLKEATDENSNWK